MCLHDFGFCAFPRSSCLSAIRCWGTLNHCYFWGLDRGKLEGFLSPPPGKQTAPWGTRQGWWAPRSCGLGRGMAGGVQRGVGAAGWCPWGWGSGVLGASPDSGGGLAGGSGSREPPGLGMGQGSFHGASRKGWGSDGERECDPGSQGRTWPSSVTELLGFSCCFSSVVVWDLLKKLGLLLQFVQETKGRAHPGVCVRFNSKLPRISWISLQFAFIPFLLNIFCHRIQGKKRTQAKLECKQGSDSNFFCPELSSCIEWAALVLFILPAEIYS